MTSVELLSRQLRQRSQGVLVALEGGDGSGKSTQIALLKQRLDAPVLFTREPGGTALGSELRRLVMHGPADIDSRTEALIYAADRAYHVNTVIRPALARGESVITDRFIDSSAAYQGLGRGLGVQSIRDLSLWATAGLDADLVIILDIPPEVGEKRRGRAGDRIENASRQFHEDVRAYYRESADKEPQRYRLIDATKHVEEVFSDIVDALEEATR